MNNKAILCNGSRLTGKDVAIKYLKEKGIPLVVRECKDNLHKLTQMFFCVPEERYWEIYNNRDLKEKPLPEFKVTLSVIEADWLENILNYQLAEWGGYNKLRYAETLESDSAFTINLSIREAMIYVSEIICKPRFGENYFGLARANSIRDGEIIIDGSTGFESELPPLVEKLGQENILLLRIHRDGCTFAGDSRSLIPDGIISSTVDVYNNGSEEDYLNKVYEIVKEFLDK